MRTEESLNAKVDEVQGTYTIFNTIYFHTPREINLAQVWRENEKPSNGKSTNGENVELNCHNNNMSVQYISQHGQPITTTMTNTTLNAEAASYADPEHWTL